MSPTSTFSASVINQAFPWLADPMKYLWPLLQAFLSPLIPSILIGLATMVIFAIFLSFTFGRVRQSNGVHPQTNRDIGSLCYLIFHTAAFLICWKIWGSAVFDKDITYFLQIDAFMLVRIFLMGIGFWVY